MGGSPAVVNGNHDGDAVSGWWIGSVTTFDIGTFDEGPDMTGPYLCIRDDQMAQLHAVQKALNPSA